MQKHDMCYKKGNTINLSQIILTRYDKNSISRPINVNLLTFPNNDNIKFSQNMLENRLIVFSLIFLKQIRGKSTCGHTISTPTTAMMTNI